MLSHKYWNRQYRHIGKNMEDPPGACLLKVRVSKTGSHHSLYFTSLGNVRVGYKRRKSGKTSDSRSERNRGKRRLRDRKK